MAGVFPGGDTCPVAVRRPLLPDYFDRRFSATPRGWSGRHLGSFDPDLDVPTKCGVIVYCDCPNKTSAAQLSHAAGQRLHHACAPRWRLQGLARPVCRVPVGARSREPHPPLAERPLPTPGSTALPADAGDDLAHIRIKAQGEQDREANPEKVGVGSTLGLLGLHTAALARFVSLSLQESAVGTGNGSAWHTDHDRV